MKSLIAFCMCSLAWSSSPQSSEPSPTPSVPQDTASTDTIKPLRLAMVSGAALGSFGAAYYAILRNAWWSEQSYFKFANDFEYAANVDKLAHLYGGYLFANFFHDGLRWSGLSENQSLWGGAGLSVLVQLAIETKDGYAPDYGFSYMDPTSGLIGSLIPIAQHHVPLLRPLRVKFSYWYHHNSYWDMEQSEIAAAGYFIDDYRNQDYWFSYNPNSVLPKNLEPYWPDFLAPALGISMVSGCQGRPSSECQRRYTLGLDLDLEEALGNAYPKLKRPLFYLDQYKWPAPSLELYPHFKFKIAYPMTF